MFAIGDWLKGDLLCSEAKVQHLLIVLWMEKEQL